MQDEIRKALEAMEERRSKFRATIIVSDSVSYIAPPPKRRCKKLKARDKVKSLIRGGHVTRPDHCVECKRACKPQAHHPNYDRQTLVVWLCGPCHERCKHSGLHAMRVDKLAVDIG